jgi:hypothetical protein
VTPTPLLERTGEMTAPVDAVWSEAGRGTAGRTRVVLPLALLMLVTLLVALRWLTRSQYLFDLDSILYARALDNFDLRLLQPDLPGYFFYIKAGQGVRAVFGDANFSLELLSSALGALTVGALYVLGREVYDHRTGVVAALLALTGPVFWFQSSVASPRIAEAFFAALIVWLGVRLRKRNELWTFWALTVVAGVAGGVRQQVLLYLIPFLIWATWQIPLQRRLVGALIGGVIVATWLVPTLISAGGLDAYRQLSAAQYQNFVVDQTGVFSAHGAAEMLKRLVGNLAHVGLYILFTCPLGLAAAYLWARGSRRWHMLLASLTGQAVLFASVPALLFFTFIHIEQIGHIMVVAPLVVLVVARQITRAPKPRQVAPLAAAFIAANLLFVYLAPAHLLGNRVGTPSVAAIRDQDAFISATISAVRAGSPDTTVVIASPQAYGFIEEYAPGYRYYVLPGLFESATASPSGTNQQVLSGSAGAVYPSPSISVNAPCWCWMLRPSDPAAILAPGVLHLPPDTRRVVTAGNEYDLAHMLHGPVTIQQPDSSIPSLAIAQADQPLELQVGPGRLMLLPVAMGPAGQDHTVPQS